MSITNEIIAHLLLGFWKKNTSLHVVDLVDEASGGELVQKEEVARVAVQNQDGENHSQLIRGEVVGMA